MAALEMLLRLRGFDASQFPINEGIQRLWLEMSAGFDR
jgi:hypothetical protein